jgi:hypothetical protein
VCRFHVVARKAKQSLDEVPYKLFGAITKLAGITFWSIDFFLDSINLGFFLREKLAAVLIIPSSWGSQLDGEKLSTPRCIKIFFWRRCWGKRRLLQGEFRTHILYFVLVLLLLYFYLHQFIKNTQKIVSFVVVLLAYF